MTHNVCKIPQEDLSQLEIRFRRSQLQRPGSHPASSPSPRTRLGGFVHLPRLIDKARAAARGTNGEFHYDCPLDGHFFAFTGIKASEFMRQVKTGNGDGELLAWVMKHLRPRRTESEIANWSAWYERKTPSAVEGRGFFNEVHKKNAPEAGGHRHLVRLARPRRFCDVGGKP